MPKSRKLEELQAQLNQIRAEPTTDEAIAVLRQILASKHNIAIAQAARIIRDADLRELMPDLVTAFNRLMQNPATADPNCLGKKAIAEALYHLEYSEESLFLSGIHHVQMEPVWGGQVDTAPGLRATCALGLVRMNYPDVMVELADLLADPESEARIGAVRALAYTSDPQAVPLLRLKVQIGDEATVLSECFAALLRLTPTSLPLVARFLNQANPQISEMAALALGESRIPEALPLLQTWWKQTQDADLRQTGLLAIAMLRNDAAIEFLLDLIQNGSKPDAQIALAALRIYQDDRELATRIQQQLDLRPDGLRAEL
nr:MAG: HEAT repeat domain-containing protein [Leptolyngbya sp. IPPAS B-1204]